MKTRRPRDFHFEAFGIDHFRGNIRPMRFVHSHCELELNFLDQGDVLYQFPDRQLQLPPSRLIAFFAITPHELVQSSARNQFNWITIPAAYFFQWQLPDDFARAILSGHVIIDSTAHPSRIAADAELFRQWHEDFKSGSARLRHAALLEIQARLERLARDTQSSLLKSPATGRARAGHPHHKVEEMVRLIASHYTEQLCLADIAAAARLHPHYATELFHQTIGMTPIDFLTRQRLAHAQRLLATTSLKVSDIAMQSGFGSLTRFYDTFARACGKSPRQFRADTESI